MATKKLAFWEEIDGALGLILVNGRKGLKNKRQKGIGN
jgi:hypothetical protein